MEIRPVETVGTVTSTTFAYFRLLRILRRLHPNLSSSLLAERLEQARDVGFLHELCSEPCDRDCAVRETVSKDGMPAPSAKRDLKPLELDWPIRPQNDERIARPVVIVRPMPIAVGLLFDLLV